MSLELLSRLLSKHHNEKEVIIIDEYDIPIQQGHVCGFYQDVVNFMRNLFLGGLKDNSSLAFGFMTGILRIAKESILFGNEEISNPWSVINYIENSCFPKVKSII